MPKPIDLRQPIKITHA